MLSVFEDDIVIPEYDCTQLIGKDHYSFFFPIEISDFVVHLWTRGRKDFTSTSKYLSKNDVYYSVSIYQNGKNLLSSKDPRFRQFSWAPKLYTSWSEEKFSNIEVDQILRDLKTLASSD